MHLDVMVKREKVFLQVKRSKILEDNGADVVGLNCFRGPKMTMKLLPEIRKSVSCHVAACLSLIEQRKKIQDF